MTKPNLKPAPRVTSKRSATRDSRKGPMVLGVTLQEFNEESLSYIRPLGPNLELSVLATVRVISPDLAQELLTIAYDRLGLSQRERIRIRIAK